MLAGIGVDIVDIARIEAAINRHGRQFINRVFTKAEIKYCSSRHRPAQNYAARFAAKEAVFKILRTGLSGGIRWTDVEIINDPAGCPSARLRRAARDTAQRLHITKIHLSISHTHSLSIAIASADKKSP
jgi:holo-[acyl-carrier protein] synthase